MRDYSKVSGQFWTGKTGKFLRGDMQAQIIALYLMTSPHANMIGVFHCPVAYMSYDTGSPLEGAMQGLEKLIQEGYCTYDHDSDTVWVHEMAKYQIGEALKSSDNRVKDIQKQYAALPEGHIKQAFYNKYKKAYHLPENKDYETQCKAPSEALPSQEQEQEQEQEQNVNDTLPSDHPPEERATEPSAPTRKGLLSIKLRALGFEAPLHLPAWGEVEKFTDEEIISAAENIRKKKPGERLHLNYLAVVLTSPPKTPPVSAKPAKQKSAHDIPGREAFAGKPVVSDGTGREIPINLVTNEDLEKEGFF